MATPKAIRTPFTKEDDALLMKYLSRYCPTKEGRFGNSVYKDLVANAQNLWPWSKRHTWQSWRERYKKNWEYFDPSIVRYQNKHHIPTDAHTPRAPRFAHSNEAVSAAGDGKGSKKSRKRVAEDVPSDAEAPEPKRSRPLVNGNGKASRSSECPSSPASSPNRMSGPSGSHDQVPRQQPAHAEVRPAEASPARLKLVVSAYPHTYVAHRANAEGESQDATSVPEPPFHPPSHDLATPVPTSDSVAVGEADVSEVIPSHASQSTQAFSSPSRPTRAPSLPSSSLRHREVQTSPPYRPPQRKRRDDSSDFFPSVPPSPQVSGTNGAASSPPKQISPERRLIRAQRRDIVGQTYRIPLLRPPETGRDSDEEESEERANNRAPLHVPDTKEMRKKRVESGQENDRHGLTDGKRTELDNGDHHPFSQLQPVTSAVRIQRPFNQTQQITRPVSDDSSPVRHAITNDHHGTQRLPPARGTGDKEKEPASDGHHPFSQLQSVRSAARDRHPSSQVQRARITASTDGSPVLHTLASKQKTNHEKSPIRYTKIKGKGRIDEGLHPSSQGHPNTSATQLLPSTPLQWKGRPPYSVDSASIPSLPSYLVSHANGVSDKVDGTSNGNKGLNSTRPGRSSSLLSERALRQSGDVATKAKFPTRQSPRPSLPVAEIQNRVLERVRRQTTGGSGSRLIDLVTLPTSAPPKSSESIAAATHPRRSLPASSKPNLFRRASPNLLLWPDAQNDSPFAHPQRPNARKHLSSPAIPQASSHNTTPSYAFTTADSTSSSRLEPTSASVHALAAAMPPPPHNHDLAATDIAEPPAHPADVSYSSALGMRSIYSTLAAKHRLPLDIVYEVYESTESIRETDVILSIIRESAKESAEQAIIELRELKKLMKSRVGDEPNSSDELQGARTDTGVVEGAGSEPPYADQIQDQPPSVRSQEHTSVNDVPPSPSDATSEYWPPKRTRAAEWKRRRLGLLRTTFCRDMAAQETIEVRDRREQLGDNEDGGRNSVGDDDEGAMIEEELMFDSKEEAEIEGEDKMLRNVAVDPPPSPEAASADGNFFASSEVPRDGSHDVSKEPDANMLFDTEGAIELEQKLGKDEYRSYVVNLFQ